MQVTDEQRRELVRLIQKEGYSIAKASKATNIPYDNAKAINRTYQRERRINKINYQQRYLNSKQRLAGKKLHKSASEDQSQDSLQNIGLLLSSSSPASSNNPSDHSHTSSDEYIPSRRLSKRPPVRTKNSTHLKAPDKLTPEKVEKPHQLAQTDHESLQSSET